jgi:hypothetical protein
MFRVILPRKDDSFAGDFGGIASHAPKKVSFTHSSESSILDKML